MIWLVAAYTRRENKHVLADMGTEYATDSGLVVLVITDEW